MQFKVPEPKSPIVGGEKACGAFKIRLARKVHRIHSRCWIFRINPWESWFLYHSAQSGRIWKIQPCSLLLLLWEQTCAEFARHGWRSNPLRLQRHVTEVIINKFRTDQIGAFRQVSEPRRVPIKQLRCTAYPNRLSSCNFAFYLLAGRTTQINDIAQK